MSWLRRVFGGQAAPRRASPSKEALDALTLTQLAKAGADLSRPTEIIHYLYLPTEAQARDAARELEVAGYAVDVRHAAQGSTWLALSKIEEIPSADNIGRSRARF